MTATISDGEKAVAFLRRCLDYDEVRFGSEYYCGPADGAAFRVADVKAKRKIIDLMTRTTVERREVRRGVYSMVGHTEPCDDVMGDMVIKAMLDAYADRDGFDPTWRL